MSTHVSAEWPTQSCRNPGRPFDVRVNARCAAARRGAHVSHEETPLNLTDRDPALEPFDALIGTWATEGTHPMLPGVVVPGSITFEWLEGRPLPDPALAQRPCDVPRRDLRHRRPETGDGLVMECFDSRGVRRTTGSRTGSGI
jgi:hypothetical protein